MVGRLTMSIEPCQTWECINSFANWLAAVGTIAAVVVALWLSRRDRAINLKAIFDIGVVPESDPRVLNMNVFALSFANYGPRTVVVNNFAFSLPFSKKTIFLFPQMDSKVSYLCTKLPAELLDGKEGHIFFPADFFNSLENPEIVLFHKRSFIAWFRIYFFKILISTSVGKKIPVKISKAAREKLWSMYRK